MKIRVRKRELDRSRPTAGKLRITKEQVARTQRKLEKIRGDQRTEADLGGMAVPARCSVSNHTFYILMTSVAEGGWRVTGVRQEDPVSATGGQRRSLSAVTEIDWTHYPGCPYCQSNGLIKHPVCGGKLSCAGSVKKKLGVDIATCAWCHVPAPVFGTFDTVSGERTSRGKGKREP